jgi:hypothetical protein
MHDRSDLPARLTFFDEMRQLRAETLEQLQHSGLDLSPYYQTISPENFEINFHGSSEPNSLLTVSKRIGASILGSDQMATGSVGSSFEGRIMTIDSLLFVDGSPYVPDYFLPSNSNRYEIYTSAELLPTLVYSPEKLKKFEFKLMLDHPVKSIQYAEMMSRLTAKFEWIKTHVGTEYVHELTDSECCDVLNVVKIAAQDLDIESYT